MQAYSALAQGYEQLFGEKDGKAWAEYVLSCVKKYSQNNNGVDAGCGTGFITRELYNNGFNVTGTDCSIEMLNEAVNKNPNIPYVLQKIQNTKGFSNLGFFTAINETFNYLTITNVKKALTNINSCLQKNGFLMFDIASEYKLKTILGNNQFTGLDQIPFIWQNTLCKDKVYIDFTCFYMQNNGTYIRKDESQVQYIHSTQSILNLLAETGFKVIKMQGHLGKKLNDKSERINFLVKKV